MPEQDYAVEFSLRYLGAIENHLKITWNEREQPVCVIDWIDDSTIDNLRRELRDLINGALAVQAREYTAKYGTKHIQTVGFGHASNFSEFVKLGFIYGERVVLWDVIGSRLLAKPNISPRLKCILAETACNLLLLRPVIEQGGLIILSHPVDWSTLAQSIDMDLRARGNRSAATLGLSIALAAIEEGLPIHPYTLVVNGAKPEANLSIDEHIEDYYSTENYVFQSAISSLLKDQRAAYLQEVPAAEFYSITSQHPDLQHALRGHFIPGLRGLSPQQTKVEVDYLTDDLVALMAKRNKNVKDYVADGAEASLGFVVTSLSTFKLGLPLIQSIVMGSAIALPLLAAVRKWKHTPEKNVIVQAFQKMNAAALQAEKVPPHHLVVDSDIENMVIVDSVEEAYKTFMSFCWTEERHHFLEKLSPEVAHNLLKLLDKDDLEIIVNHRKFQQDYIGDYLSYLWNLDEDSFWKHLGKTFESEEGLLIYDNNVHIEIMCAYDMPQEAWLQLLDSLLNAHRSELQHQDMNYPLECFPEIVHFQTMTSCDFEAKRLALIAWFNALGTGDKVLARWFLDQTYGDTLPVWFTSPASM